MNNRSCHAFYWIKWFWSATCDIFEAMLDFCYVAAKSGVEPSGCLELVKHVSQNCPNLEFCGLMTIGMPDYTSTPENFKVVVWFWYHSPTNPLLTLPFTFSFLLCAFFHLRYLIENCVLQPDISEMQKWGMQGSWNTRRAMWSVYGNVWWFRACCKKYSTVGLKQTTSFTYYILQYNDENNFTLELNLLKNLTAIFSNDIHKN